MSEDKTGGSAFPELGLSGLPNDLFIHPNPGMTLRDYFAAAALQGELACQREGYEWAKYAVLAEQSYAIADEMLKARES